MEGHIYTYRKEETYINKYINDSIYGWERDIYREIYKQKYT